MVEERPQSRGSSLFSDLTEPAGEWVAYEGQPPRPLPNRENQSVEPDSSSDAVDAEVVEDDFSGPADSTSWWNYEDDVSEGPADSTTP